jgi:lactoylglutathione lyase
MTARFEELVVFVNDVEITARFYETVFGFARRKSGEKFAVLEVGAVRLSFQDRSLDVRHGGEKVSKMSLDRAPPPFELAFDVTDVDETYRVGVEAGGEPLEDPHDTEWGDRIAHLRDPNGVLIGLSRIRS